MLGEEGKKKMNKFKIFKFEFLKLNTVTCLPHSICIYTQNKDHRTCFEDGLMSPLASLASWNLPSPAYDYYNMYDKKYLWTAVLIRQMWQVEATCIMPSGFPPYHDGLWTLATWLQKPKLFTDLTKIRCKDIVHCNFKIAVPIKKYSSTTYLRIVQVLKWPPIHQGTTTRKTKQRGSKSLRLFLFSILMLYLLQKFH